MADTKQGRDKKALREAREAELRVVESDVDALDDDAEAELFDDDDEDVDPAELSQYLVDEDRDTETIAADRAEYVDLAGDE